MNAETVESVNAAAALAEQQARDVQLPFLHPTLPSSGLNRYFSGLRGASSGPLFGHVWRHFLERSLELKSIRSRICGIGWT